MKNIPNELLDLGRKIKAEKNEDLFYEGDPVNGFYYIESGAVRIYRLGESGKELEVLRLNKGDFVGEAAFFSAEEYPVTAQAIQSSSLIFFSKDLILGRINSGDRTAAFLINLLAEKCLALNSRMSDLFLKSVKQRLIEYFLETCPGTCGSCANTINLSMKKSEIARHLGTISETLSRTFKDLQKKRLIKVNGRKITVPSCAKLRQELKTP